MVPYTIFFAALNPHYVWSKQKCGGIKNDISKVKQNGIQSVPHILKILLLQKCTLANQMN